jgi:hypothetical protein
LRKADKGNQNSNVLPGQKAVATPCLVNQQPKLLAPLKISVSPHFGSVSSNTAAWLQLGGRK